MTNEQIEDFYESLANYYQRSFKVKIDNSVVKKGIFSLCRRKDFNFEMVCSKDYSSSLEEMSEDKFFTITLPLPFSFDHEENSILLDYRISPIFKNRNVEIINLLNLVLTTSNKHHRFMDKIVELYFLDEEETSR